jgi:hypothetical protein
VIERRLRGIKDDFIEVDRKSVKNTSLHYVPVSFCRHRAVARHLPLAGRRPPPVVTRTNTTPADSTGESRLALARHQTAE